MSKVTRRECREVLFQCLYSSVFNREASLQDFLATFFQSPRFLTLLKDEYFMEMYEGVRMKNRELSRVVSHFAQKFDISLVSVINILPIYIALYEMLYLRVDLRPDAKISLNEGIGLSKVFCDESNKRLTNGVLHSVISDIENCRTIAENSDASYRDIYTEVFVDKTLSGGHVRLEEAFLSPTQRQIDRAERRKFDIDSLSVTQNIRQSRKNS